MNSHSNGRTVADIVRDLVTETTALLRKETQLARAEIAEKADQLFRGIGFVVAGAALAIPGVVVLLGAAVVAMIDAGVDRGVAALAVGAAALLIGVLFAWIGARAMKAERLVPHRTIAHVQRDVSLAKNQLRPHHEIKRAA
ncbi:MAG TPA: phage holin family protein [Casimicrobiaceae bacterium]